LAPLFRPRVRRWLQELRPHVHPNIRSTSLLTLRRFAKEKMGVAVLPCYLGDTEPSLKRWFPPIKDLADELWIVSDIQVRETARVRAFFEHMENLTPAECDLLEGRQLRPRIRTRTRSSS
jgi:DNA-binding transcriptional LysR family regulator